MVAYFAEYNRKKKVFKFHYLKEKSANNFSKLLRVDEMHTKGAPNKGETENKFKEKY